ncbi:MAG: Hsp33 family molecular chaperone HslO [Steroidobacteraceae bacterium]|jgi:molecular chaperone Hsp33|nr:Hsp33 family molecular chaperone HslO [Steroidobacteraceae bacterium]
MRDGDTVRRFLFERFPVRGYVVHLDASWRALVEHHDYPPVIRDTLGEAAAATVLLASTLKFEGLLTLQMQGPGPMHLLVSQATHRMAIRAVARFQGELPPERRLQSLAGTEGHVTVTIESEDRTNRYQGIVPLVGDGLAACLQHYFERSEQLPTRLWLAATPERAAGLLLQRLPTGASASSEEDEMQAAEGDENWNRVLHLAQTLTPDELVKLPGSELLRRLFHEEDVRMFDAGPVFFQCTCSRERVTGILRSLGEREVMSVVEERGEVEVRCEFCNRAYRYDAVDVAGLFAATPAAGPSAALQ